MNWREMKIACAAVMHGGVTFSMPRPARHCDVLHKMYALGVKQDHTTEQGFLTDTGEFVRRKPACMIADNAGQLAEASASGRPKTAPYDTLFSEDLW